MDLFAFLQKRLEETAPEIAQKNINLAILRDLDVPVPPVDLQREFARRVEAGERGTESVAGTDGRALRRPPAPRL